jgi:hypothetical protein
MPQGRGTSKPGARRRRVEARSGVSAPGLGSWAGRLAWAGPPIAVVLLCLPCLHLPYEWDDFDFLARVQNLTWHKFLPDPSVLFYRPFSREAYYGVLSLLGPDAARWGHLLNAALLALAVFLLGSVASRLAGPKAGLFTAAAFASLGTLPVLVGILWCAQDLFALVFILLALRSHAGDKPAWGVIAMAAALLSKETAAALIPVMVGLEWALGRGLGRLRAVGIAYLGLLGAWLAIHPGLHILLARKFESGGAGYIGLDNPGRFTSLAKGLVTLTNAPILGPILPWSSEYTLPLLGATILLVLAITLGGRGPSPRTPPVPLNRVIGLSTMMVVLPMVMGSMLVRNWSPYYSCIPALGSSILIGLALSRLPLVLSGAALVGFLTLGVLVRLTSLDPTITTEHTARSTAVALNRVRSQFLTLYPTMPRGTHALVSVGASGTAGVYAHIHRFQALRIWYGDPGLRTFKPSERIPTTNPELLFRITPDLSVVEIDPDNGRFRTAGSRPSLAEIRTVVRSYARAVAASEDPIRAASILLSIPDRNPLDREYDARLAVALLLSSGKEREAASVLNALAPMTRPDALELASWTALEPIRGDDDRGHVLQAFGISSDDIEADRYIMRYAQRIGYDPAALAMARRVQRLAPSDAESAELIKKLTSVARKDLITVPVSDE